MKKASILAAAVALGFFIPAAAAASILYTFAATTGDNFISWSFETSNFITSQTSIAASDLDTCTFFPAANCDGLQLDPRSFNPDEIDTFYDNGPGTADLLTSYFPDGALGANGFYYGLNDETLYVTGTPDLLGVPEPATWAMMLLGLGAIGFALRRTREGAKRTREPDSRGDAETRRTRRGRVWAGGSYDHKTLELLDRGRI
jgi:hypothetical protein